MYSFLSIEISFLRMIWKLYFTGNNDAAKDRNKSSSPDSSSQYFPPRPAKPAPAIPLQTQEKPTANVCIIIISFSHNFDSSYVINDH